MSPAATDRHAQKAALLERQDQQRYPKHRLEALSDGVVAIAVTLLVLELAVPAAQDGDLLAGVIGQWPSYLAYLVSFATIGAVWTAHSLITGFLVETDANFLRLNLLLLLVVSFLPFPTRLVAEHLSSAEAERVAVAFYGVALLAAYLLISLLWRYATRARLTLPDIDDADVFLVTVQLTRGIVGYVVLIAIGLIWPLVAVTGFLLVAVLFLLPTPTRGTNRPRPKGAEAGPRA